MFEDAADSAVGALDVGLLRGAVGGGVEHPHGAVGRAKGGDGLLDAGGIGERAAVDGEDDREEPLEQLGPRDAPENAEEGSSTPPPPVPVPHAPPLHDSLQRMRCVYSGKAYREIMEDSWHFSC